jgi:hypothetical protein
MPRPVDWGLWLSGWWVAAFAAQWVLLVALGIAVVALARQLGTLHLRLGPLGALEIDDEGPPLGEGLAPMQATADGGSRVTLGGPAAVPRIALFVSEHCPICATVKPGLPAAARSAGMDALVLSDAELEGRLAIPGTPYVIVVDRLGIVRSKGTVNNLEQLEGLVDTAEQRIDEDRVRAEAM